MQEYGAELGLDSQDAYGEATSFVPARRPAVASEVAGWPGFRALIRRRSCQKRGHTACTGDMRNGPEVERAA